MFYRASEDHKSCTFGWDQERDKEIVCLCGCQVRAQTVEEWHIEITLLLMPIVKCNDKKNHYTKV